MEREKLETTRRENCFKEFCYKEKKKNGVVVERVVGSRDDFFLNGGKAIFIC